MKMSKFILAVLVGCQTAVCMAGNVSPEQISVYRDGHHLLLIRSSFSAEKDLLIKINRFANEYAYLIPKDFRTTDYYTSIRTKGILLHAGSDDYPASPPLGSGYGTLSGNHGSPFTRIIEIPDHAMTEKDIGTKLTDDKNHVYYIINILDRNRILIHPEWSGKTDKPGFVRHSKEKLFCNGQELKYKSSKFAQMYPLNRITDIRFLVNGKDPLPDKTEVKCEFLDYIFVHDVVNPGEVVNYIKTHPGKKTDPEMKPDWRMFSMTTPQLREKHAWYAELPALATFHNRYRHEARGSYTLYRTVEFKASLGLVKSLDVMFCWNGAMAKYPVQEFYIPKVKKMTLTGRKGYDSLECDISKIYKMPKEMQVSKTISKKDCLNPEDMPDRFIRLCGSEEKREIGVALGYSLIHGHSAKINRGKDRDNVYFYWHTKKVYPYIYTLKNTRPGQKIETVVYKQYLNPQIEPDATDFYYHKEFDADVIYLDFHKTLTGKRIKLPASMTGKKLTVIEQTPSVKLHTTGTVPADGLLLDVAGEYGYIVLKAE